MANKRGSRPMLNRLETSETALIWNPNHGFRLYSPDKDAVDALTLPETFLSILHMQITEELMVRMMNEYLAGFRKH